MIKVERPDTGGPILQIGDRVAVERLGRAKVVRIDVALRPSTDPAAEQHFANVESIELGEHGPPFVVDLEGGAWAYGTQVDVDSIERDEEGS